MKLSPYNLFISLYHIGIKTSALFNEKPRKWLKGRENLYRKLADYSRSAHGKKLWVHCASLGEFEQARPLIDKIKKKHSDIQIIITFFSPSGFEPRRFYQYADYVSYLPLDTRSNAIRFIKTLKPDLVIWVKYEFWYHFLHQIYLQRIPLFLISSVFRPQQIFFKWYGDLHRQMLSFFTQIFVQNQESMNLLRTLSLTSTLNKDTRFDRVYEIANEEKRFENIKAFKGDKKILIAGSTWIKDADLLIELINKDVLGDNYKFIIAPHEVTQENIRYLTDRIKKKKVLFSRLTVQNAPDYEVLVIDGTGILSAVYYYGDIAYIGGGFDTSIHNILEPIVYGMPVIFGPQHLKSNEAIELLEQPTWQVAHTITNYDSLLWVLQSLTANNGIKLSLASQKSKEYIFHNIGATDRIYEAIEQYL